MYETRGTIGATNLSLDFGELLRKYNMRIKGIIQIGAHYGQEYEIYKEYDIAHILFFEPLSKNFEILKQRVGKECVLINKALGNKNQKIKMYVEEANGGRSSSVLKPKKHLEQYPQIIFDQEELVDMVRLDDVLDSKELYNCIVIDVQGYELEVFKGSTRTLEGIDYIITEINRDELYESCVHVEKLDEFLKRWNFKRTQTNWEGQTWGDALYIKSAQ